MIIKITVNLKTLDAVSSDTSVSVNEIKIEDGNLLIEISKPDDEQFQMMAVSGTTWQQ
jgi:hypothetical protein